jgi:predicted  nucleic acid-binding Zn-ribbon protein
MSEELMMSAAGEERSITTITDEIIFYKGVGGQAVIEIGKRLMEAKAQLKHGEWLPWLSEKVEFSETSAQNFMRVAREYGNTQLVGDLGVSKALALLALPASERENFASEKHLANGEEKSVAEMSKRELEEAVRQQKIAEAERNEARRALEAQRKETEEANAKVQAAQDAADAARAEVENAQGTALAAQERAAELERELKALREQPVDVAVQTVDASKEQIAAAVAEAKKDAEAEKTEALGKKAEELKKAKDELKKAKAEMAAAAEALKKAEDERTALRETLEKTKKSAAAMDNKALAEFSVLFRQAQETVNRMTEIVDELDEESRPKIYRALDALAQLIREKAGEAV